MQMPSADTVTKLLSNLLGEDYDVAQGQVAPKIDDLMTGFGSICFDDEGKPVCAILADLVATVSLGGKLMMLPMGGLEDQISEGKAEEMVVDAVSEVFNNLTTTINRTEGNPHIRSNSATSVTELLGTEAGAWMKSASARGEYAAEFCCGKGRVVILTR